ncbi:MAG TPA: aspartyl protease family protein [Candidatus Saccharimonadales bacterium]|nr:aspartyl protease family protein [Candidatus Saccharimonadales bacterium]
MGLTRVAVKLLNSDSHETYNANFLVDTGCMDTMAPASDLKKIGIQPVGKDVYELASGEFVEWEYGIAQLTFMGEIIGTRIIFGPEGSEPLLGVVALESAGFIVDPKNQVLRKLRVRPLKSFGTMAVAS